MVSIMSAIPSQIRFVAPTRAGGFLLHRLDACLRNGRLREDDHGGDRGQW
jgi:hypothetical protein